MLLVINVMTGAYPTNGMTDNPSPALNTLPHPQGVFVLHYSLSRHYNIRMSRLFNRLFGLGKKQGQPLRVDPNVYFRGDVWKPVDSSNVKEIAYMPDLSGNGKHILAVRFLNHSEYRYYGVSLATYTAMLVAQSKGRFVLQRLRDQYPFERVG